MSAYWIDETFVGACGLLDAYGTHLVPYVASSFLIELYDFHNCLGVLFLFAPADTGFLE